MSEPVSWSALRAEVLELYEPPLRRAATRDKVRQVLDGLGRHCGSAADLTPRAITRWLGDHPRWRPATARTMLSTARAVCHYAVAMGYLARSPFAFRSVKDWLPRDEPEPIVRHRSAVEIGKVLVRADSEALGGSWEARRDRAVIYALAFTGARAREILGLHRDEVDQGAGLIHIRPNARRPLKTRASRRSLPIAPPLLAVLLPWLAREDRPSEWAFPHGELTGPWLHGTIETRALGRVRALGERAGVPGLTLLGFRHSFATAAEGWGLGELAVQRLLGHGRPQTQATYRHADPEQLRPAMDRIRF